MKQGLLLAALVSLSASAPPPLPLPHNGRIAYVETEQVAPPGLARIDATGKGRSMVDAGDIRAAVMSPDGTRFAYVNDENHIVARATGGARTLIASGHLPAWSPDSRRLAFVGVKGVEVAAANGVGVRRVVAAGSDPTWSPTGSWIAFYGPNQTLAVVHPDGSDLTTIATGAFPLDVAPPAWSADGAWLSFSAVDSTTTDVGMDVVAVDGSNRHTLGGSDAAWSPRSDVVAFDTDAGLRFATGDGRVLGTAGSLGGSPAWSPDGRSVAVGESGDLALVNAATFAVTRLTGGGTPVWSRDGRRIASVVRRTLAVVAVNGSERHVLAVDAVERPPLWDANGRVVYFALASVRNTIVATAPASGKDSVLVRSATTVAQPPDFAHLTWSPDGRELAFNRVGSHKSDLEVVDSDGKYLRVLVRQAFEAAWSPDGRRLAFRFDGIEAVAEHGGAVRRLTNGNDTDLSWSPNGKWIAFLGRAGFDLEVIGADGRRLHRLASDVSSAPSWSPDGKRLAFSTGSDYEATAVETIAVDGSGLRVLASAPLVVGGAVLTGSWDGRLVALDAATGALRWSFQTHAPIKGGAALAGVTTIVGSYDGFLYALDSRTGALRWSTAIGAPFYATPTVAGDRVIDATADGVVHALDTASGAQLWSRRIGRFAYSAAAVAGGRAYIGSYDHRLYALDVRTGDVLWTHRAPGPISGAPTVLGGLVYFSSCGSCSSYESNREARRTFAVDALTGRLEWTFPDGEYSPVVSDGLRVYLTGYTAVYGLAPR